MQWAEVVKDPSLRNLPYKIDLNAYGQILMTPHWPIHSEIQSVLQDELGRRLKGGRAVQESAIQTSAGVRVADVVWRSDERWGRIREAGAVPAPIAPEICIEIQSRSNSPAEMIEKRALYFEVGELRFFDPSGELDRSILVPSFPPKIQV